MTETIEEALDNIAAEIEEKGYNPTVYNIYDDTDMIHFALNYLLSNIDDAFVETAYDGN